MKVLVLGSGGREHALAWRMSQDEGVEKIWVMPGNPGMSSDEVEPLLKNLTLEETRNFCREQQVTFVMVGPEKYLFEGWVDELTRVGIAAVGPTRAAAKLEESKAFSKSFMAENKIPTAQFFNVATEAEALAALEKTIDWSGVVVKLSGPALGKGVVVTDNTTQAREVVQKFYADQSPGIEGGMVIEEKLGGKEVSLFYACLDQEFRFLASACDHKRLLDNDQGPNTGGMGAVSPCTWADAEFLSRVEASVVKPTLKGMANQGSPYRGILFIGLMGESLLEYNVRFGDPETQAVLPLLEGNLAEFLLAMGKADVNAFKNADLEPGPQSSIHIVKAARGYPGLFGEKIEAGQKITSLVNGDVEGMKWFFAGVKSGEAGLQTSGGRVLGITAWAGTRESARARAYQAISQIKFEGEQFRTDIGGRL